MQVNALIVCELFMRCDDIKAFHELKAYEYQMKAILLLVLLANIAYNMKSF